MTEPSQSTIFRDLYEKQMAKTPPLPYQWSSVTSTMPPSSTYQLNDLIMRSKLHNPYLFSSK
jgi:hypothetical protein